ncbi:H(+)/Cl(-) exchange transporter 5-like protein 2 [Colletotrichum musicola]|uniref:H(+)/Cl(-) exchange transporter 5-like protein 2 n=1 Tax=Colletotrichum musicola TaxID=2175873 RepID=A0A8H6NVB6_9PEZI|nr:H(+)/Cl(-) exchange transporter 5-like protein 2 [Colletotrichum musicola]
MYMTTRSGIPEIKAILSGFVIPSFVEVMALALKIVGVSAGQLVQNARDAESEVTLGLSGSSATPIGDVLFRYEKRVVIDEGEVSLFVVLMNPPTSGADWSSQWGLVLAASPELGPDSPLPHGCEPGRHRVQADRRGDVRARVHVCKLAVKLIADVGLALVNGVSLLFGYLPEVELEVVLEAEGEAEVIDVRAGVTAKLVGRKPVTISAEAPMEYVLELFGKSV